MGEYQAFKTWLVDYLDVSPDVRCTSSSASPSSCSWRFDRAYR